LAIMDSNLNVVLAEILESLQVRLQELTRIAHNVAN